jgi:hypothetical protein
MKTKTKKTDAQTKKMLRKLERKTNTHTKTKAMLRK